MGTPGIIAAPLDYGFQGRYVNWDGAPTSMVPQVRRIVTDLGVDRAREVLTEEHYSWSMLTAATDPDYTRDGRFVHVPGVGVAHTTHEGQTSPDAWYTQDDNAETAGWAYLLNNHGLTVLTSETDTPGWEHLGTLPWNEDIIRDRLVEMECGADFTRCCHQAWVHVPDLPDAAQRMSMRTWLGHAPLGFNDASGVIINGRVLALAHGGSNGSARYPRDYTAKTRYWWGSTADRSIRDLRLARMIKGQTRFATQYKTEHPLVLPATAHAPETVVAAGTVLD